MLIALSTFGWVLLVILYFVLLVTLGVRTLRNGHGFMFLFGIFFPLFWLIGALMAPRETSAAG